MANLKKHYLEKIIPTLQQELKYSNIMQVPKVTKIVLNCGVGEAALDKKKAGKAAAELTLIAGQKAVVTKARKSIAGFKIRDGWPIGAKVTLRGKKMYDFLEKLLSVVIPRVRDFRGLNPKSFDGRGNYTLGIKEQIVFPEIDYDKVDVLRGLDITIVTSAVNNVDGLALLKAFEFPFKQLREAS